MDARHLPGGWLTFLFADIAGSAVLVRTEGFASMLAEYRRRMRRTLAAAGGVEVAVEADNCFFVFTDTAAALDGCASAQRELSSPRWPADLPQPPVKMGVHTGFARPVDGEYVCVEVYHTARVASAAHGGQVLCTAAAASRVELPPDRAWLIDLGRYRLRDFPGDERLFQLAAPGLRRQFPFPRCERLEVAQRTDKLTRAESAVASLVGQGLSNPQIAQRLYISRYTVETHLKHIFVKLALSGRTELAALVARES